MISYYSSILVLCGIALAALSILVWENDRIPRSDKRLLYLTYVLVAASAFSEWCGVQLDGRTEIPDIAMKFFKCADYTLTPAAGGVLVMQMRLKNGVQKAINIILIANAALQIASAPGGGVVIVDAQNHYSHGPLFPVYIGICVAIVVLISTQFILYGRTFRRQNHFSLYVIMSLIFVGIIIQELLWGHRTAYVGVTFAAVLMFIHYTEYSQLRADEEMAEQRIQLMLSQIKPHFLYNTLGSIEALCGRDPMAAKTATRKLSKYLRGNMDSLGGENLIPFEKELSHTELFLDLERVRFGDALQVKYDISARSFLIPPLTLEPIVENAVKHGIRMNEDGHGTVSISTKEQEDHYELQVTDNGPGYHPENASADEPHIGIRNVRERLQRICGGTLTISPAPVRGTVVTIILPK